MSYSLPKYYFQDLPAEVMDEIMPGMADALPEPSWEEIDQWLCTHNVASTIPGWYDRAGEFTFAAAKQKESGKNLRSLSFCSEPWRLRNRFRR